MSAIRRPCPCTPDMEDRGYHSFPFRWRKLRLDYSLRTVRGDLPSGSHFDKPLNLSRRTEGYTETMPIARNTINPACFNPDIDLPYQLRKDDFRSALQDVYDFFHDVNEHLISKGLQRLDDILRPAIMSGVLSDMLTSSLATHSRVLVENKYFNGHPDLVVQGVYPNNAVKAGEKGVEIKTTRKKGGAVDTHGARNQWMCVFV